MRRVRNRRRHRIHPSEHTFHKMLKAAFTDSHERKGFFDSYTTGRWVSNTPKPSSYTLRDYQQAGVKAMMDYMTSKLTNRVMDYTSHELRLLAALPLEERDELLKQAGVIMVHDDEAVLTNLAAVHISEEHFAHSKLSAAECWKEHRTKVHGKEPRC